MKKLLIGGSAAPRVMVEAFEYQFGIPVSHAWGVLACALCAMCPSVHVYGQYACAGMHMCDARFVFLLCVCLLCD